MSRSAMRGAVTAYLGLGGNVGDVIATMSRGLQRLDGHRQISVNRVSPVYRTPPWGIEDQDWFCNACAEISTTLEPLELLENCLATERQFGRIRDSRWGPRTIDIDILVFGNVEMSTGKLTLPHPRMLVRAFVLKPLLDIAPGLQLNGETPGAHLERLEQTEMLRIDLPENWWLEV